MQDSRGAEDEDDEEERAVDLPRPPPLPLECVLPLPFLSFSSIRSFTLRTKSSTETG